MANQNARQLRRDQTEAEIRLWSRLKARQLGGCKFRRQHPIGHYIADFVCLEEKLVVEVDGGQHNESSDDASRTGWLEGRGYRVMRFWNNEVLSNTEGVLEAILTALNKR